MNSKEKLEEEVEFWLSYISRWRAIHNEPVPERAQQLLSNALLKLKCYHPDKTQEPLLKSNNSTIH